LRLLGATAGTLWHRGRANRSNRPRLIITPQYCAGRVRQLKNMALLFPPSRRKNCRSAPAN
jgi:hypothetical protein